MIPQPEERHPEENYWTMMNLFNANITNEETFWDALKCTYTYYKESSVEAILRKQKAIAYFHKKEIQFSDKKPKHLKLFSNWDSSKN